MPTKRKFRGIDHRWLSIVSIVLVAMCVVYVNQRDELMDLLGDKRTVILDFVTAVVMLVNTRLREIFGRPIREVPDE